MNIRRLFHQTALILPGLLTLGVALATPPIPITADEAFDAVTMGVDPESGNDANVALIDIRDPVEYFSSGAAAKATEIQLLDQDAKRIDPDGDKVRLVQGGKFVEYSVNGRYRRMLVSRIDRIQTEPLAFNIPFWRRIATSSTPTPEWDKTGETAFYQAISDLVYDEENEPLKYDVLILYCRTGGRSSAAGEGISQLMLPIKVYEIDVAESSGNGRGGFSGSNYSNAFNGHVGFPDRQTDKRDYPSVSWLDSGLPITTSFMPVPVP